MTVTVRDSFEIKEHMAGSQHAPGVVVLFDAAECRSGVPAPGCLVEVRRPNGGWLEVAIGDVKEHGTSRSFFFASLRRTDLPVGSEIRWKDDPQAWRPATTAAALADRHD